MAKIMEINQYYMSFLKDNLELIQQEAWLELLSQMYQEMFDSNDAKEVLKMLESADIKIPDEVLEKSLLHYTNDISSQIMKYPQDNDGCTDRNGNLILQNAYMEYSYHHNGWPLQKCLEVLLNQPQSYIKWPKNKIKCKY